jgi:GxxExxY protein
MQSYWESKHKKVIEQINKRNTTKTDGSFNKDLFEYHLIRICKDIHEALGNSLLEKCYQDTLYEELCVFYGSKFVIKYEEGIPVIFNNKVLSTKRLDISVYSQERLDVPLVIIELKNTSSDSGHSQISHYMEMTGCAIGYLINFGHPLPCPKDIMLYDTMMQKNVVIKNKLMSSVSIIRLYKSTNGPNGPNGPNDSIGPPETNNSIDSETGNTDQLNNDTVSVMNNKRWKKDSEELLLEQMTSKMSLEDISKVHKRTSGAIIARVVKLGLYENIEQAKNYFNNL